MTTSRVMRHFGELLTAARLQMPYSRMEFARAVAVGKAKVIEWEAGTISPTASELGRIAHALRSDPARLVEVAAVFRLSFDGAEVAANAAAMTRSIAPRPRIKGYHNQPPASLPPMRDPTTGRFISAFQSLQWLRVIEDYGATARRSAA